MKPYVIENIVKKVLFIHAQFQERSVAGRIACALVDELQTRNIEVILADNAEDGKSIVLADSAITLVLIDWDLPGKNAKENPAADLVTLVRHHRNDLPIFLCSNRSTAGNIDPDLISEFDDYIWLLEDSPEFISGRIEAAINRYSDRLLPPMFNALVKFGQNHEYSWHTPGHNGGVAFMKHPVGRFFSDYFGKNMLRSDLSISVGELGSLLDHSGPIGMSEKYAARVFGADRTYHVTNGSSTSNRVIMMASVTRGQIALIDRNCHKSAEHAITLSGAVPSYLVPSRNGLGIIGPILPEKLTPEAVRQSILDNPLAQKVVDKQPKHVIITNSTYDGICYNVSELEKLLGSSCDHLHFDEAWYGYAKFHPMYRGRFAMHDEPRDQNAPTVFATQSTHKLLAALSQASYIHVRDGRKPVSHARFNESFMMHASTSPNYAIIASNDVAAAMMDGNSCKTLMSESIAEAVAFRQMLAKFYADAKLKDDWFFNGWQPDNLHTINASELTSSSRHWVLQANAPWHGFGNIPANWAMLDPIKVSVLMPGMSADGTYVDADMPAIPATIVTRYLSHNGIQVEKTIDFTILFLFSLGITKGKWGTLISELGNFKRDYDKNVRLEQALPELVKAYPKRYQNMGLKDLCNDMFTTMRDLKTTANMAAGFSFLPTPDLSPTEAYENLVNNEIESLALDNIANRTVATGVVPYPPGIPILMPGENTGGSDGPILSYLKALEAFDNKFPGFEHDTHGVEVENGKYHILCVK